MSQVLEYRIKISMRVAAYKSHQEMQSLAKELADLMSNYSRCNPDFVCEGRPTVDVIYEPPKPQ